MESKYKEINLLRSFASKLPEEEIEWFYKLHETIIEEILKTFHIIELSILIHKEKDGYLREMECRILMERLLTYEGPITLEYLDDIFGIFSIENIRKLAYLARFSFIREKADIRYKQVLETMIEKEKRKIL